MVEKWERLEGGDASLEGCDLGGSCCCAWQSMIAIKTSSTAPFGRRALFICSPRPRRRLFQRASFRAIRFFACAFGLAGRAEREKGGVPGLARLSGWAARNASCRALDSSGEGGLTLRAGVAFALFLAPPPGPASNARLACAGFAWRAVLGVPFVPSSKDRWAGTAKGCGPVAR